MADSSSALKPKQGERSTAINGMSWWGLSMTASMDIMVEISTELKNPPPWPEPTGTPYRARTRRYTPPTLFTERSSMAMSPYSIDRCMPWSVTVWPESTSSLIFSATMAASRAVLSGDSSSSAAPLSSSSISSGGGTLPGYWAPGMSFALSS